MLLRIHFALILFMSWTGFCLGQPVIPNGERLRNLAPRNFHIGGVFHPYDDSWFQKLDYRLTAATEFNAMTGTAYMAYGAWPVKEDGPIVSRWHQLVDWCNANDCRVHGHILVYPNANIDLQWFQDLPNEEVEPTLFQYVDTMARLRSGEVWSWDVVNEVMADDENPMDADGLRFDRKEYVAMGPTYIDKAFQWARAADPDALLILNEYSVEETNAKSDRLLAFAKKLKNRGVPIDGIGFQMHITDLDVEPDYGSIANNFRRFARAGFRIFITEMDVVAARRLTGTVGDRPTQAQRIRQRKIYRKITKIAAEQPACESLLLWDFADEESWLHPSIVNLDGLVFEGEYTFPTPFWGGKEGVIRPKPAYYGIQDSLRDAIRPVNLSGIRFRVVNQLDTDNGYLLRNGALQPDGSYSPGNSPGFFELNDSSENWSSLMWVFEYIQPGQYRIRSEWGKDSGYLQMTATEGGLVLKPFNQNPRQKWNVTVLNEDRFRIQNSSLPQEKVLSRQIVDGDGTAAFGAIVEPLDTAKLQQEWELIPVDAEPDDDDDDEDE